MVISTKCLSRPKTAIYSMLSVGNIKILPLIYLLSVKRVLNPFKYHQSKSLKMVVPHGGASTNHYHSLSPQIHLQAVKRTLKNYVMKRKNMVFPSSRILFLIIWPISMITIQKVMAPQQFVQMLRNMNQKSMLIETQVVKQRLSIIIKTPLVLVLLPNIINGAIFLI